ncbi:MAG: hypothetical protein ACYTG4_02275 [Planctomycetota bacterium]
MKRDRVVFVAIVLVAVILALLLGSWVGGSAWTPPPMEEPDPTPDAAARVEDSRLSPGEPAPSPESKVKPDDAAEEAPKPSTAPDLKDVSRGRVLGPDGPMGGVRVDVLRRSTINGEARMSSYDEDITSDDGSWYMNAVRGEFHSIVVRAPTGFRAEPPMYAAGSFEAGEIIEFRLLPRAEFELHVVDAETGEDVESFIATGPFTITRWPKDGRVRAASIPYPEITVVSRGYLPWSGVVKLDRGTKRDGIRLELQRDPDVGTLELVLNDAGEDALAGVVVIGVASGDGGIAWSQRLDGSGPTWRIERVPSGTGRLAVFARERLPVTAEYGLKPGTLRRTVVEVSPHAAVRLRVRGADGKLLARPERVILTAATGSRAAWDRSLAPMAGVAWPASKILETGGIPRIVGETDLYGRLIDRIVGLVPGAYAVTIRHGDRRRTAQVLLEGGRTTDLEVDLRGKGGGER